LGAILPRGAPVHHLRCRSRVHLPVGGVVPRARVVRLCGDDNLPRHFALGSVLHLEERGAGMGLRDSGLVGIETKNETGLITTRLDEIVRWGRKNSLWPLPFGTACCAIEFMGVVSS